MSDSVANLTVKVDVKSVSAAVAALDKLASVAGKVEKSVSAIGAASAKQAQSSQSLEKWVSKSESAFEKMNRRLEDGAKKYQQVTRLVNQHALSEGVRADTMARLNRSFEDFNRTASKVNASNKEIQVSTRLYNDQIDKLKDGISTISRLERQRASEMKKNAAETARAAKEAMQGSRAVFRQTGGYQDLIDRLTSGGTGRRNEIAAQYAEQEKKAVAQIEKSARVLQARMEQAQTTVFGISTRARRQLPTDAAFGISQQAEAGYNRLATALRTYGVNSLEAGKATGEFNRTMKALSSEIARTGGLLPRLSDNARTISAAFGAANASLGG